MSASVAEWIIADGLGGYAMGTRDGIRTRRYHGLLLVASPGTEQRFMLVNGVEAWLDTPTGSIALNSHRYVPGTVHPDGATHITRYFDVGAAWDLSWADGDVRHSIAGVYGNAATVLRWRVGGNAPATLRVRLQMSGRDWHALHHENPVFRSEPTVGEAVWRFQPYNAVPPVMVHASARYRHAPLWFRQLQYDEERARGQDFIEDLCSPGEFTFEVTPDQREAVMVLTTSEDWGGLKPEGDVVQAAATASVPDVTVGPWSRVADTFVATRGERRTIIAGYPWFTDWGRDTFISVRGLCITLGRLADAEAILSSWCEHLSQGMMPNLFPSGAGAPEYNSVDASLWFIVAVHDLAKAVAGGGVPQVPLKFVKACEEILTHYSRGTRHNIRVDSDGLLAAGAAGIALTWMDAIVDGRPVTPRIGKPVEVQALWINALEFASSWNTRWRAAAARARDSFAKRFWNEARGCLYDVVDVDHVAGAADDRVRPNQVFAIGGLPVAVVDGARAESIFAVLQGEL
ncbi:MAG TPA: amylo-alpha-1,6-glucosidase, partial [Gemmatimonadaceae bacterium]